MLEEYCIAKSSWLASCSTLTSSTQRTTIVNNRFRPSHFVYNSWLLDGQDLRSDAKVEQEAVWVFTHIFYWKKRLSLEEGVWRIWMQRCQLP